MLWIHWVFSSLRRFGARRLPRLPEKYLNSHLNDYVFRWNRRRSYRAAFDRLIGIGVAIAPATCADIRATASA